MRFPAAAPAALILGLAACSSHHASTTTPTTTAPTTTASQPATTATSPPTTSLVGLTLTAQGTTLTPPAAPTVKPYSPDCHTLVDTGFDGGCVNVVAPTGTMAAIVETQRSQSQTGAAPSQERDLVYVRHGQQYSLALRRVPSDTQVRTELYQSDVMRDGDPKAVFVTPAPNVQFGNELDVVEADGRVTLFRNLHGGFADVASGGGLQTFVPNAAGGYDTAVIRYAKAGWTITAISHVSQTQAQGQDNQPFFDPIGTAG